MAEPPGTYTASALKLLIIAGPNGAGKTTFAREYLPREAGCHIFINADYIAHGLSPFSPELAALKAGKVMLRELDDHLSHRRNVAIETTLSGRRYARLIPRWRQQGYAVKLIFLALPSVDLALARVAIRVRQGGHAIPEPTVRRRFTSGQENFERVYKPLVDAWAHYDSSGPHPVLIEEKEP
ncbi:MAG: zeta toxin family protein [Kiritimatiellia bacterium]|nr:zeta toxin family protein [Kiritimatiellia bacterium]MDP6630451.1 zeta toxin family protein [Kiritimatiellia bacterium]MDP6809908.1 zeta toxin family protein [Kiritimatiellia bacterium]MDP7024300.1 zeta toxin family protein [Kiritimatiellia bacterium]